MKKRCPKCGKIKLATSFYKDRSKRNGLSSRCKTCCDQRNAECARLNRDRVRIYHANYYKNHRERWGAANARSRKAHPGKAAARATKWQKENPEKRQAICAKYYKSHRDKYREALALRRARERVAVVEPVSRQVVYERDMGLCHICGRAVFHERWHLDHIIPLSKGGEHSYRNVAVSHPLCNLRKAAS